MLANKILIALLTVLLLLSGCMAGQDSAPSGSGGAGEGSSSTVPPVQKELPTDQTEGGDSLESQTFQPPIPEELFGAMPREFIFESGAGAWATCLTLAPDGSFTGLYHDTEMGDTGEDYPNGTEYFCEFSGNFSEPVQVNDYTFSVHVNELTQEGTPGEVICEDGFRSVCSEPFGLAGADEVLIYCPNAPMADLPEEFVWWSGWLRDSNSDTLDHYGLYNVNEQLGFSGYQYREG